MPHESLVHDTHTFERAFPVPVSRLFAAWEDPDERAIWGSPDPSVTLRVHAADFSVGGEDLCDCVERGPVTATVRTRWLVIERDRRIVSTESISDPERALGVSLISAEFQTAGKGSKLVLTVQTTAFDGSGLEQGVMHGWGAALDSLGARLDAR